MAFSARVRQLATGRSWCLVLCLFPLAGAGVKAAPLAYTFHQDAHETSLLFVGNFPLVPGDTETALPASRIIIRMPVGSGQQPETTAQWGLPAASAVRDISCEQFDGDLQITIQLTDPVRFEVFVAENRCEVILKDSLHRDPLNHRFFQGVYLQKCQRYAEALQQYSAVLEQKPAFAAAYYKAGQIRAVWRDFQRAEVNYRNAEKYGCDSTGLQLACAELFRMLGNEGRAQRYYEKYRSQQPVSPALIEETAAARRGLAIIDLKIPLSLAMSPVADSGWSWNRYSIEVIQGLLLLLVAWLLLELWWRYKKNRFFTRQGDRGYSRLANSRLLEEVGLLNARLDESAETGLTADLPERVCPLPKAAPVLAAALPGEKQEERVSGEAAATFMPEPEPVVPACEDVEALIANLLNRVLPVDSQAAESYAGAVAAGYEEDQELVLEKIRNLHQEGLTLAQIARRTSLGQEEIALLLWVAERNTAPGSGSY